MSEQDLHFANPPIVEAVVDIECDFAADFNLKSIEESLRQTFVGTYPKTQTRLLQEFSFAMKPGEPVGRSARQALQAFQFLHDDSKQLVQARTTGYSFNRLAPYSSLDEYLPEIQRTWNLYRAVANPIQIRAVQLRYINRILLPMPDGQLDLDLYFRNGPRLPEGSDLTFNGFLNQSSAVERETGYLVTTVLTAEQPQESKLPIIFDVTVRAVVGTDPADWGWLEATMRSLRGLKNRVFVNTLKQACLNLFQ
ncbi:MAG TPA: TIGR04255 family protein [Rhodanobacteraceae bacterium]|nr:TIGR04255 family protein [Rhodanobacteraceae bacterium]